MADLGGLEPESDTSFYYWTAKLWNVLPPEAVHGDLERFRRFVHGADFTGSLCQCNYTVTI